MSTDAMQRIARCFHILQRIQNRKPGTPLSREDLARECHCSVRTIQRDINLLSTLVTLEHDVDERAYVLLDKGGKPLVPVFTPSEVLALALARALLTSSGIPQQGDILAALDRATAGLSPRLRELLSNTAEAIAPQSLPRDYSAAPLPILLKGAMELQTVEMDYESLSSGSRGWRRIDPYQVSPREGIYWEMHGWCHVREKILTFALDRVYAARLLPESFTRREEAWQQFRSQVGVRGMRGDDASPFAVDVRFAPEVGAYAERFPWPDSLTVARTENGAASLTGTAIHRDALVSELLRWRRHATVLGGPELLTGIREEIDLLTRRYFDEK